MEVKIDEKSIKKWSQDGKASWHRFLMDFGGFLEASWEGKWSQDRSQEASKKRWKNGRHQDGQKVSTSRNKARETRGPEPRGGIPLIGWQTPPPSPRKSTPPSLSLSSFLSLLSSLLSPLSCLVLSWPVLACLGLSRPVFAPFSRPNLASKIH